MKTARDYHTATLLRNGKVLVAGGYSGPLGSVVLASTELYDPATNHWSQAAPMLVPHASHTAALLPDGRVLVASGRSSGGDTAQAEIYDPGKNVWSKAGNLSVARTSATAVMLNTGKVLVIGGDGTSNPGAELYDPGTNSWSQLPNTTTYHVTVASALSNGKVLVLGGANTIYDPKSNTWASIGPSPVPMATAGLLGNGKVLFVRPLDLSGDKTLAELFDPATDTWTPAARLEVNGLWGTATALPDGRALVAGSPTSGSGATGCGPGASCPNAEVYDPASDAWTVTSGMATTRGEHTATLLTNGKVLITGGFVPPDPDIIATAEIYDPSGV